MATTPVNVLQPKLLSCSLTLDQTDPIASYWGGIATTDLLGKARSWNVNISINMQLHSSASGMLGYGYTGNDVNVGDYITTDGGARFLRIVSII